MDERDGVRLTWLCACGVKHVDDHEPLVCCACGAEWNPLRAAPGEVDRYLEAAGWDRAELHAAGERLAQFAKSASRKRRLARN